jgi:hypothetical protein
MNHQKCDAIPPEEETHFFSLISWLNEYDDELSISCRDILTIEKRKSEFLGEDMRRKWVRGSD